MYDEIRYAGAVSRDQLNSLFSSRQLVEMASSIPARIAHIDDKVGTLAVGMDADLFLLPTGEASQLSDPYRAITGGTISAIDLVMIGGVPLYGDPGLLHKLNIKTQPLSICGAAKALNADALPAGPFAQVESRLKEKMKTAGASLAPLAECADAQ
jgi:5-methylthioadenosine/S-adenosylhomocysteine deaminase